MAVRVPQELKDRLEQAAAREGVHVSELVRLLLREGLDQPRATPAGSR
ncbi:ribbon-helix-helix protein, CopG family [Stenotrophomonas maltophilia]